MNKQPRVSESGAANTTAEPKPRRSRGQSAGLDLGRIIAAARGMDPNAITMQAIADELGVDRSAINNHVAGKDALLMHVALDTFAETFATVRIGRSHQWQDLCRTYARGFAESVIATGALAQYLVSWGPLLSQVLHADEAVLGGMIDAGLDSDTAARVLALISNVCLQYAHDHIAASDGGQRPRIAALRQALEGHDPEEFPNLISLATNPPDISSLAQLEISIEIVIRGTEALVEERGLRAALRNF